MKALVLVGILTGILTTVGCGSKNLQLNSTTSDGGTSSPSRPPGNTPPFPCGEVDLAWTAPTVNTDGSPLTNLGGYIISWGTTAGNYPNAVTVNSAAVTSYTLSNLVQNNQTATYYFVLQAFNTDNAQSVYTNPVNATFSSCAIVDAQPQPLPIPGARPGVTTLRLN